MRFEIKINGEDLSENVRLEDCTIRHALSGEIGSASFTLLVDEELGPRYDFAHFGTANYSTAADIENMDTVEIFVTGASPPEKLFSGYASRVAYERRAPNLDEWRFECQDHTLLLDSVIVNDTWTSQTDQYIIQDAFGALSEVDTTNVASTQTLASFEAKDLTLRKLLERLREITGADWFLTPDKYLYYNTSNFAAAPFGVSDAPDEVTTYPYELEGFTRDQSQLANRVTVLGALNPSGGSELSATVNDTSDQTERGRIVSVTLVERSITNSSVLTIKANMELTKRVAVQESGELVCWEDGLGVGQGVSIVSTAFSINGTYRIRELEITKVSESEAAYRVSFGAEQAQLTELLRQFNAANTKVDQAIPPNNTIGNTKLDRTTDPISITNADIVSLEFSKVTNVSIENSDIVSLEFSKVTNVSVTNSQIVSLEFSKVTNVSVTDSQIVSLAFSKVTNVLITNSDIDDLTIQAGKIANLTITGGKIGDGEITSAKIDTLVVSKLTGWEGETISIGTGMDFSGTGNLTMAGGGNLIVTPGYLSAYSVRGGLGGIDIPAAVAPYKMGGTTVIDTNRHGSFVNGAFTGTFRLGTSATAGHVLTADASGYGTWQAPTSSFVDLDVSGAYKMDGTDVINSSRQFIGGGANCNAGIAGTGFNIYGGSYFGQTSTALKILTDLRYIGGGGNDYEYKYRDFDFRGGVVTSIGTESAWQTP